MTPEAYQKVRRLLESALALPPEKRNAYLDEHCESAIRKEVDSLLAEDREDSFLERGPTAPALSSGTRLGDYEVVASLGAGGMGEVYRARDTKLGRDVAIKVLPQVLSPDRESRERLQREARLLAQLNHANVATLYGLEEHDGQQVLIMELVGGETLDARIARGPLSVEAALHLFRKIAAGLEAAHEKNIIHRDLKPSNVKITLEGHVKILDFGLGKAFGEPEGSGVDSSQTPTITRTGAVLGTAAYMSPEQARGEHVDKRTDIWAFGCCLYEALTGKPAFWGATVTDILASVVKSEPDWERLPPDTPFLVRRVLERCLTKDRAQRTHDIADVRLDLEDATIVIPGAETTVRSKGVVIGFATALGIALLGLSVLLSMLVDRPRPEASVTRLELETSPLNLFTRAVAFSRDGRHLAYVADNQIFLRSMDRDTSIPIAGTENAQEPIFSPDGEWMAFENSRTKELKKVPIDGGAPVTLCGLTRGSAFDKDWESDDTIVLVSGDGLYRVPATGGEPERLIVSEQEGPFRFPRWPDVLPGGRAILFTAGEFVGGERIALYRTDTGERSVLLENANFARYAPTGHILFVRDDTLHAIPFDLDRLTLAGKPVPVLEDLHISFQNGSVQYAFSETGSLAYVPSNWEGFRRRLVWVDHAGNVEPIRSIPRRIAGPNIAPDGDSIALHIYDGTHTGLWLTEASRETLTPLLPGEIGYVPTWSPDGERIAFFGMSEGGLSLFVKSLRDASALEMIAHGMNNIAWSPNGSVIAFVTFSGATLYDIWTVSLEGDRTPSSYLKTPSMEGTPAFSPDGRWLAYASNASRRVEIYVGPYGRDGIRHQISTGGGFEPLWSSDGREIYYRSGNRMMAVTLQTEPTFRASSPRVLFEGNYLRHDLNNWIRSYDLSPDGEHFLMIQSEEKPPTTAKIKIVLNWFEELKRLVPPES